MSEMNYQKIPCNDGCSISTAVKEWRMGNEGFPLAMIVDFDGVLSDNMEDRIYKLGATDAEEPLLERATRTFNMNISGYDSMYRRHLIYQAAASELGIPISPGPALTDVVSALAEGVKLFVLTARSGFYATKRLHEFLVHHELRATEVFQIGRVPKHLQVIHLFEKLSDHRFLIIEDSFEILEKIKLEIDSRSDKSRVSILLLTETAPVVGENELREKVRWALEEAILRKSITCDPKERLDQLKDALEHARAMFVYHAGQRLTSLRYFFATLAVLFASIVAMIARNLDGLDDKAAILACFASVVVIMMTGFFWALDYRNQKLVECDEDLLNEVEREYGALAKLNHFCTVKASDNKGSRHIRYGKLLPLMFLLIIVLMLIFIIMIWTQRAPAGSLPIDAKEAGPVGAEVGSLGVTGTPMV